MTRGNQREVDRKRAEVSWGGRLRSKGGIRGLFSDTKCTSGA